MSIYTVAGFPYSDELYHFGIKGQKWGIRRYQNPDGTLTAAGKARYGGDATKAKESFLRKQYARADKAGVLKRSLAVGKKINKEAENTKEYKELKNLSDGLNNFRKELAKAMGVKESQIVFDEATAMRYNLSAMEYNKKLREITNNHIDELAEATLQDLGYDVTDSGKEYVKKLFG